MHVEVCNSCLAQNRAAVRHIQLGLVLRLRLIGAPDPPWVPSLAALSCMHRAMLGAVEGGSVSVPAPAVAEAASRIQELPAGGGLGQRSAEEARRVVKRALDRLASRVENPPLSWGYPTELATARRAMLQGLIALHARRSAEVATEVAEEEAAEEAAAAAQEVAAELGEDGDAEVRASGSEPDAAARAVLSAMAKEAREAEQRKGYALTSSPARELFRFQTGQELRDLWDKHQLGCRVDPMCVCAPTNGICGPCGAQMLIEPSYRGSRGSVRGCSGEQLVSGSARLRELCDVVSATPALLDELEPAAILQVSTPVIHMADVAHAHGTHTHGTHT